MAKRYWLMKSEPEAYSYDRLVEEGRTIWDGAMPGASADVRRAVYFAMTDTLASLHNVDLGEA